MDIDLRQGDAIDHMKLIQDKSIDFIMTDPPYNTTDCKWDKRLKWDEYWEQWKRIIKDTGTIAITAQMPFATIITSGGLDIYRHKFVWEKDKTANFMVAKSQPLKYTEDVFVFAKFGFQKSWNNNGKPKSTYNPQMRNGTGKPRKTNSERFGTSMLKINNRPNPTPLIARKETDGIVRYPSDIIYFTVPFGKKRFHPTQKPILLMEYLIKTYTNKDDLVLDCFFGSGTTAIACMNTNRNFIGIELDKSYFAIAKKRVEEKRKEKENEQQTLFGDMK